MRLINIYPANRLENLVVLLDKVMQTGSNTNILSEEIILVQSKGMQHWLNLKLAESRGISMNLAFSLPTVSLMIRRPLAVSGRPLQKLSISFRRSFPRPLSVTLKLKKCGTLESSA